MTDRKTQQTFAFALNATDHRVDPQELGRKLEFPKWFEIDRNDPSDSDLLKAAARGRLRPRVTLEQERENRRCLKEHAIKAFEDGNVSVFLSLAPNTYCLELVVRNTLLLRRRGIFEETLLKAITATRSNNLRTPLTTLRKLILSADRSKLLAAGDPLPGSGPFTLYRGVAGRQRDRRVRGISWTGMLEKAGWFAQRFGDLEDPAVYKAVVEANHVAAYVGDHRNEDEFIIVLPRSVKVERISANCT